MKHFLTITTHWRYVFVTAIALHTSLAARFCFGNLAGASPFSWIAVTADGEFTFAGVSSYSIDDQLRFAARLKFDATELAALEANIRQIHRRFPVSGMYRSGDTDAPLWGIDKWVG
jgi:hypothetical protein